jgi:hypothetical protein
MRRLTLAFCVLLVVAACGDDDNPLTVTTGPDTTQATTIQAATTTAPTTTSTPPTTAAPATTTTVAPPTTTTTAGPTAREAFGDYFGMVEDLDRLISDTAAWFNDTFDPDAVTLPADVTTAINALDASPIALEIPPGLSPQLETAALAVYADLESRVSALQGATRYMGDLDTILLCLGYGGDSFDRFDADFVRVLDLADVEPAPTAAPDSPEAGILAVRVEWIRLGNWGCDSCGGASYDEPLAVDWEGRRVIGSSEFEATFDGTRWQVVIYAC